MTTVNTEHPLLRGRTGTDRSITKAAIRLTAATRRARENTVKARKAGYES